jgi:hypothetical protein
VLVKAVHVALLGLVSIVSAASADQLALLRSVDAHGQPLDPAKLRGEVVAVTFCSRYTQREVGPINDRLQAIARPGDTEVISVIDFDGIPSLFHEYARRKVRESERTTGAVKHIIDEQGKLKHLFDADPRRRIDILVLDRDGNVRGHFIGANQVDDAMRLIDDLRRSRM